MSMRRRRKTKIVATLGPASSSEEKIAELSRAGVDVFRINMSHTSHEDLTALVERVRNVEREIERPIAILVDLQGPKLRLGNFADGSAQLKPNATVKLILAEDGGNETTLPIPHPEIFAALKPRSSILIDDGKVRLRADTVSKT